MERRRKRGRGRRRSPFSTGWRAPWRGGGAQGGELLHQVRLQLGRQRQAVRAEEDGGHLEHGREDGVAVRAWLPGVGHERGGRAAAAATTPSTSSLRRRCRWQVRREQRRLRSLAGCCRQRWLARRNSRTRGAGRREPGATDSRPCQWQVGFPLPHATAAGPPLLGRRGLLQLVERYCGKGRGCFPAPNR